MTPGRKAELFDELYEAANTFYYNISEKVYHRLKDILYKIATEKRQESIGVKMQIKIPRIPSPKETKSTKSKRTRR